MSDLLLARRRVSSGLASVPVGSDRARPTRTVPTSTPSTRPLRRGADGRGGTFRCCGQPPLRSISVVSFDTGGKPRVPAVSGGGGEGGCCPARGGARGGGRRPARRAGPPPAAPGGVLGPGHVG